MRHLLRPLRSPDAFRGWTHAFLAAAAASLVGLPVAAVLAVAWPGPVPGLVLAAAACAALGAAGLPRVSRRGAVGWANRLLGAGLSDPVAARRFATAAWFLAAAAAGTALMLVTGLALVGLGLPVVWLDGGGAVTVLVPVEIRSGAGGAWTLAAAVGALLGVIYSGAAYAALMRRAARALLGPGMAERLAATEAEARRVASRNRLARELHDSIGHTLTTSTIQAAVARETMESDPESARLALASIEDSSRTALDELDRALGVLREEPAPLTAAPTLADLGRLGERVRKAGSGFDLETEGDTGAVPPAVSREAYRIVQEAVTNALKHAPGAAMEVLVRVAPGRLELRIANEVESAAASAHGRGLTGIAERARLLGGDMSAGPDGSRRWVVRAELPLGPDRITSTGSTRP